MSQLKSIFLLSVFVTCAAISAQERIDTTQIYHIDEVIIQKNKKVKELRSTTPLQELDGIQLKERGILQVSDAAKFFSGVVVKDYGGIGGLKTISIRSLGAAHTAVSYDGLLISDAQTGQIDLGKLSLDNIESITLNSGQSDNIFQSARLFSSAGVLQLNSIQPTFTTKKINTLLSLKAGSFGLLNPNIRLENKWSNMFSSSINFDYLTIDGNYPYKLRNGTINEKRKRENSDIESWKTEINLYGAFKNNQKANLKLYYYQSERGLPTNILYNTYAGQRLWDKNFFTQTHYENKLTTQWSLQTNAKLNWSYNRYYDPSTYNTEGYTNDYYYQNEYYLSATVLFKPISNLSLSLANDGFINTMRSDISNFAVPTRYTLMNAFAAKYIQQRFTLTGHLLSTFTTETVRYGESAKDHYYLSPSLSFSVQPFTTESLRLRAFYKDIFRMPTFNDLYYGNIGRRDLKPEKAKELNGGIVWSESTDGFISYFSLSVDAFYNRIKDKIIAVPSQNLFVWSMMNIGRTDIKGTELRAESSIHITKDISFHIQGNYTWQRALDKTDKKENPYKVTYNHQIPYTPRHSGSLAGGLDTPWVHINYTILFSGERFSNQYNSKEYRMKGYQEHSLSFFRKFILKQFRINAQVELLNLTDNRYEVVANYPMPGRQFRGSISFNY